MLLFEYEGDPINENSQKHSVLGTGSEEHVWDRREEELVSDLRYKMLVWRKTGRKGAYRDKCLKEHEIESTGCNSQWHGLTPHNALVSELSTQHLSYFCWTCVFVSNWQSFLFLCSDRTINRQRQTLLRQSRWPSNLSITTLDRQCWWTSVVAWQLVLTALSVAFDTCVTVVTLSSFFGGQRWCLCFVCCPDTQLFTCCTLADSTVCGEH